MEKKQIFICSGCGKPIYVGEYVHHILGEQFCSACIIRSREIAHEADKR